MGTKQILFTAAIAAATIAVVFRVDMVRKVVTGA